jgi:Helix-turn-helix domain
MTTALTITTRAPLSPPPPRLTYTVEEAGQVLGISRGLAYEMVREGTLPSLRPVPVNLDEAVGSCYL